MCSGGDVLPKDKKITDKIIYKIILLKVFISVCILHRGTRVRIKVFNGHKREEQVR